MKFGPPPRCQHNVTQDNKCHTICTKLLWMLIANIENDVRILALTCNTLLQSLSCHNDDNEYHNGSHGLWCSTAAFQSLFSKHVLHGFFTLKNLCKYIAIRLSYERSKDALLWNTTNIFSWNSTRTKSVFVFGQICILPNSSTNKSNGYEYAIMPTSHTKIVLSIVARCINYLDFSTFG